MPLCTRLSCVLFLTTLAAGTSAQLVADFTGTPTTGVNPLTVSFTDTATGGTPIVWLWTFGDPPSSSEQHPVHTYMAPGTYSVSLLVAAGADFGQKQKNNYITVDPAPLVVDFTASPLVS